MKERQAIAGALGALTLARCNQTLPADMFLIVAEMSMQYLDLVEAGQPPLPF